MTWERLLYLTAVLFLLAIGAGYGVGVALFHPAPSPQPTHLPVSPPYRDSGGAILYT